MRNIAIYVANLAFCSRQSFNNLTPIEKKTGEKQPLIECVGRGGRLPAGNYKLIFACKIPLEKHYRMHEHIIYFPINYVASKVIVSI